MYLALKKFWSRKRKCRTLIPSWFLCSFFQRQQNVECIYATPLIKLNSSIADELRGVKCLSRFLSRLLYAKQQYATIYIENGLRTFLHLGLKTPKNVFNQWQKITFWNMYIHVFVFVQKHIHTHTLYILQIYIHTVYRHTYFHNYVNFFTPESKFGEES